MFTLYQPRLELAAIILATLIQSGCFISVKITCLWRHLANHSKLFASQWCELFRWVISYAARASCLMFDALQLITAKLIWARSILAETPRRESYTKY